MLNRYIYDFLPLSQKENGAFSCGIHYTLGYTDEFKFMEMRSGLISLCLEVMGGKVDKIFAYASIEKKSTMFNTFFEKIKRICEYDQSCLKNIIA